MKSTPVIFVILMALTLVGCQDSRVLPSELTETYYFFPGNAGANYFTIEFDDDDSGILTETDPGTDLADPSDDGSSVNIVDPFVITGLDATRRLTGSTFSSEAGLLTSRVYLYDFKTYGFTIFTPVYNYPPPH